MVATETSSAYLYVHLDERLADDGGTKEGPKRHQKMAAGDTSKIEQRVGDL